MFKLAKNGHRTNRLLEILMIVIGINVTSWFEGWFPNRQDAETVITSYRRDVPPTRGFSVLA